LKRLVRGSGSRVAATSYLHRREGEPDAVLVEGLLDAGKRLSADRELLARPRRHLAADLDREIPELLDPLHLQRLNDVPAEIRIGGKILPDLLDELARLRQVGVEGDPDLELVPGPPPMTSTRLPLRAVIRLAPAAAAIEW